SFYFDLGLLQDYWLNRKYHHTMSSALIFALAEALAMVEEEGLEARWRRHETHHRLFLDGLRRLDLGVLPPEGERLWTLNAVTALGFGYLAYEYVTLPDVRPLATANPSTTAFMDLRANEARAAGKPVRHLQRWVGYSHVSLPLKRAVIVAEDDAFWQHEGVD